MYVLPISAAHLSLVVHSLSYWNTQVRLLKLSRNGYQQIFIDVHFLRVLMLRYVREMKTLESLADEIVKSARDRCVDLKEIDPSVVEAICKKKRVSLGF